MPRITDILLILMMLVSATSHFLLKPQSYSRPRWRPPHKFMLSSSSSPSSSSSSAAASPKGRPKAFQNIRDLMEAVTSPRLRQGAFRSRMKRDTCRVQSMLLRVNLGPNCERPILETQMCRGGCRSYSQTDPRNLTHIIHTCSCCRPLSYTTIKFQPKCRSPLDITLKIREPVSCQCRPCYAERGANEYHTVRDHLKKATPFSISIG